MKLAVLSDIHGNLPALQAVAAEAAAEGVQAFVNLGDIVSGPLWPAETAAWLMARGWPTIAGNHERQLLTQPSARQGASDAFASRALGEAARTWLAGLPAACTLHDGAVACCHGTPGSDLQYLLETVVRGAPGEPGIRTANAAEVAQRLGGPGTPRAEVLLCGHSHTPRIAWHAGMLLLNPGSVGLPGFDHDDPLPHVVETGSPHARWALLQHTPAGWQAQLRATAYDWARAAAKAEAEGRGDWADALATGRVGRVMQ